MLVPDGAQVVIRMYGQGVGDCFLLAFPRTGAGGDSDPVYVLIDCGVIGGTPGGPARMRAVVSDVVAATGGRLDLLILTHEHWDHLSGFDQASEEWDAITVGALWMAWTENGDTDGLPGVLKRILEKQQRTLALTADQEARLGLRDRRSAALGLMGFLSGATDAGRSFAFAPTVRKALDAAKAKVDTGKHTYLEPGDVGRLPGTDVAVYTLGPPRDDRRLRQIDPSRNDPETYEHAFSLQRLADGLSPLNFFAAPLLAHDSPMDALSAVDVASDPAMAAELDLVERSFPFDRFRRVPLSAAESAAAANPGAYRGLASYADEDNHWRRIDFDWMAAADTFAFQADSLTNNTSLALAFELPPAGDLAERKVLLFPADAQVGALLSWDDIPAWNARPDAGQSQSQPDIDDLLQRTVFVKVGHHGSHNATLKAKGIERMRRGANLTAFVPVSPGVAREIKGWSQMPLDGILDAFAERSGSRVVLANGEVWPTVVANAMDRTRREIGVTVSPEMLPEMRRSRDDIIVQKSSPLWIQVAVDY